MAKNPKPVRKSAYTASTNAPKAIAGKTNRFKHTDVTPEAAIELSSLAQGLELDFGNDEKAMRKFRSRCYALNKEYTGKWRFRTIREGSVLMIWRLAY